MLKTSFSDIIDKSSKVSVGDPKQANPAFLVLAPLGKNPFSKTTTFAVGNLFLNSIAAESPTIPLPTMA